MGQLRSNAARGSSFPLLAILKLGGYNI